MSRFNFIPSPLAGLTLVQRKVGEDYRGFLSRFYCADEFREVGVNKPVAQINRTLNLADLTLGSGWPLAITGISEKDRNHNLIEQGFQGITL
ncbi:MAG: hypothetical protein EPN17_06345 [Methylobacter sp.]|nr:MAG: hypothetical protein EPN17_06345 [Methylobacter sp.]